MRVSLAKAEKLCYNGRMECVQIRAHAKLNLTLEVTGREGEYHLLDSLVASLDLSDFITAQRRTDGNLCVTMRGMGCEDIPPRSNNAVRAAEAFFANADARGDLAGANIFIEKRIPLGGGLGGSSADAAGVLLALRRLAGTEVSLLPLARKLGSDTASQLTVGYQRMRGRGEKLRRLMGLPVLYFVLLCPAAGVSSAECYRKYDELGGSVSSAECYRKYDELGGSVSVGMTEQAIRLLRLGDVPGAAECLRNDLTAAACSLNGEIEEALQFARWLFPLSVGMTGSGSTVFALFADRASRDSALQKAKRGRFQVLTAQTADEPLPEENP